MDVLRKLHLLMKFDLIFPNAVLGLCIVGKQSTTELHPQAFGF
jgi:hypothetical protein